MEKDRIEVDLYVARCFALVAYINIPTDLED